MNGAPASRALEELLVAGGDTRLALAPDTGRNLYGSPPFPERDVWAFGSSTASTISATAYAAADALRRRLTTDSPARYALELQRMRDELSALLGLEADTALVFAPSGTDVHLLVGQLLAALHGPLTAVMVDAAETGRGVPGALTGRHFNASTALEHAVNVGVPLEGGLQPELVTVPFREEAGGLRAPAALDAAFARGVEEALATGEHVLLVACDQSKSGAIVPGLPALAALAEFDRVSVLVDACQFRLAPATIRAYLARGYMVALTGSKFLTGPCYSGVLLVPAALAQAVASLPLPACLAGYSARAEWPAGWQAGALPQVANWGLLLRWEAALAELRAFAALPEPAVEAFLADFGEAVHARLRADAAFVPVPSAPLDRGDLAAPRWDRLPTIFPFAVRDPARPEKLLGPEALRSIFVELPQAGEEGRFQLGQPILLGRQGDEPVGALRLNVGSRLVVEALRDGREAAVLAGAQAALDKCARLARRAGATAGR